MRGDCPQRRIPDVVADRSARRAHNEPSPCASDRQRMHTQPPSGAADGMMDSHSPITPAVQPRVAFRSMRIAKGIALKVVSVLLFAVMSALIRGFGDKIPVGQVVFFRSAF